MDLSVQLAPKNKKGLSLANPVMVASGTFGYGMEYEHLFDIQKLGAIVCKGTTLEPRDGNPQPRLAETTAGLLNSIGLQNIGVDELIKKKAPIWAAWRVPVIVIGTWAPVPGRLKRRLNGFTKIDVMPPTASDRLASMRSVPLKSRAPDARR